MWEEKSMFHHLFRPLQSTTNDTFPFLFSHFVCAKCKQSVAATGIWPDRLTGLNCIPNVIWLISRLCSHRVVRIVQSIYNLQFPMEKMARNTLFVCTTDWRQSPWHHLAWNKSFKSNCKQKKASAANFIDRQRLVWPTHLRTRRIEYLRWFNSSTQMARETSIVKSIRPRRCKYWTWTRSAPSARNILRCENGK